jgi:ubiquinone/menaquinone biosynthesis C-methylase UbiE
MAFFFKIRDFLRPRRDIVKEIGLKEGFRVLDPGCGPSSYIVPVTELIGKSGKIYALDINPAAIELVKKLAAKKQLSNVETILSDCDTGLPNESIDMVLAFDVFHDLKNRDAVLEELHRVSKPEGSLSLSDHYLKEGEIISALTNGGLFKLLHRGKRTYSFVKTSAN